MCETWVSLSIVSRRLGLGGGGGGGAQKGVGSSGSFGCGPVDLGARRQRSDLSLEDSRGSAGQGVGPLTGLPNVTNRFQQLIMSTVGIFATVMSVLKWSTPYSRCVESLMSICYFCPRVIILMSLMSGSCHMF